MTVNGAGRIDWVDYAKGICIIMVVMMHSTLGVEAASGQTGFMHALVAFAKPFRMPDFFLISGLFLARVIDRDWRTYLDRKVVHFVYFYALWLTIQFAIKLPGFAAEQSWPAVMRLYLESYIEPFGTLWFIYLLPVFFIVTKLTRGVHPAVIWIAAALIESAHVTTGWTMIDEFASRFVYFYSGYLFASPIFAMAEFIRANRLLTLIALAAWAVANALLVGAGLAGAPGVSLLLGFAGAGAVIAVGTLLADARLFDGLRYSGEHSIVIYLAFFLPMAATRTFLLKTGLVPDVGMVSLIVTIAGIAGALMIWWLTRNTFLRFLFERPARFRIAPPREAKLQAAE